MRPRAEWAIDSEAMGARGIQLLLKSTTGVPSLSLPDPTPSLIFLLTSLCAVQSERLEQESERLEQASV